MAMHSIGMTVEAYPRARPKIILGAAPILQASTNSITGAYLFDVKYSVTKPIMRPAHNPEFMHP